MYDHEECSADLDSFIRFFDRWFFPVLPRLSRKPHVRDVRYTIGDPGIALSLLIHDRTCAVNIPPHILVAEREDGGTTITYDLPTSVIAIGDRPEDESGELMEAALVLDGKLEKLVRELTQADDSDFDI